MVDSCSFVAVSLICVACDKELRILTFYADFLLDSFPIFIDATDMDSFFSSSKWSAISLNLPGAPVIGVFRMISR